MDMTHLIGDLYTQKGEYKPTLGGLLWKKERNQQQQQRKVIIIGLKKKKWNDEINRVAST